MVDREDLEALDFLLWQRTGELAARALDCHQATVSRRLARCRQVFGLSLRREQGEWICDPDALLDLERHVHQLGRFLGQRPLRLEGFPIGSAALLWPSPEGWQISCCDHLGVDRPLELLRQRVIDAWVCDADQDLPAEALADLAVVPLWRGPALLAAAAGHPLAGEAGLAIDDLLRFPSLDLPDPGYRFSRPRYRALGFGDQPNAMRRFDIASWEGQTAGQVTLVCTTSLNSLALPAQVVLDTPPLFSNGGSLLTRLDQVDQPAIVALEATLRQRLRALEGRLPACALL